MDKSQRRQNISNVISGIFSIPKQLPKANALLYPGMDENSYTLVESLRQRVAQAGKQMTIESVRTEQHTALLVGQSAQLAIFIRATDLLLPRFGWIRLDSVAQRFHPSWLVEAYLKHGRLPGEPALLSGLDWEIAVNGNGYWLTCCNPPIDGEITYSELACRFQNMYPEIDKPPTPKGSKKKEDSAGVMTHDLKPIGLGGVSA